MQRPRIDQLLPGMFQRAAGPGTMLAAVLDVMAELHEADEAILADIDAVFDPYRTPDRFVPFLARWVDLDRLLPPDSPGAEVVPFGPGYGCLRNLVATGAELAQWRGTSAGLRWFLRLATGVDGFTIVEDVPGRPFHIEVHVPPEAIAHLELVERIVAMDKPAFVTASVVPTPAAASDPAAAPVATGPGPGAHDAATAEPGATGPAPTVAPATAIGPEATAAAYADAGRDTREVPTAAVPLVPTTPAPAVPLVDLPTEAVPVAEPVDGPRWTGAGTESASIPVSDLPADDRPSDDHPADDPATGEPRP